MRWIYRLCAALACLMAFFAMAACSGNGSIASEPAVIRLNSYIKAEEPEGYDGYGTINAEIDREGLCMDLEGSIRTAKGADRHEEALKITETVSKQFYLSNTQNLKNGDRVEIIWTNWSDEAARLEQQYGIVLAYENTSISVSGLRTTESVDPFSFVKVSFTGYDGYGTAHSEPVGDYGFSYTFSKADHLSNGDTVTATVLLSIDESSESYAARTGIRVTDRTAEYTVEGLMPLTEADPFAYVTAEYSGNEPDGEAVFSFRPPEAQFPKLTLETERFTGLSNGDTVTLTFIEQEPAEQYEPALGIRLIRLSGSFTVSGLSGHVNALSSIPKETLQEIDAQAAEWVKANDFKELGNSAELKSLETVGHFLLVSANGPEDNYFGIVHRATVSDGKNQYVCYPFTLVTGLSLEEGGGYSFGSEMMRTRFSMTVKGKKGTFVLYGAESTEEIKTGFIKTAEQRFFIRSETDF